MLIFLPSNFNESFRELYKPARSQSFYSSTPYMSFTICLSLLYALCKHCFIWFSQQVYAEKLIQIFQIGKLKNRQFKRTTTTTTCC